jgi:hypothetical protein
VLVVLVLLATSAGPHGVMEPHSPASLHGFYCYLSCLMHRWNRGQKKKRLLTNKILCKLRSFSATLACEAVIHVTRNSIIFEESWLRVCLSAIYFPLFFSLEGKRWIPCTAMNSWDQDPRSKSAFVQSLPRAPSDLNQPISELRHPVGWYY